MGSKKRGSSSVEEKIPLEDHGGLNSDDRKIGPEKIRRKKMKGGGNIESEIDDSITQTLNSCKPMERKKKQKAFSKGRHHIGLEIKEINLNEEASPVNWLSSLLPIASSTLSTGLPEFHISIFDKLSSADASEREAVAEALVEELRQVQKEYEKIGSKQVIRGSQLKAGQLRYAVRRLIRGVSSSRERARQGFALGLTVYTGAIPIIRVGSLLELLVDSLEVTSSMKGQNARDCLLGRLFAYGALERSGRIKEEWILERNTPYIKQFTSLLISLASKKRYLQD
ncbi:hypothetical protein Nepgr_000502 [Nepenthes gracilis]|uniref:Uncharacterized protein n=1 Tax=Nepenthes gracilis TaxID=150966 RepID=A0AAD3P3L0_NEPGR|nr:hypothetical protein Nepgr_000502 [Nepenthes gracilis]